MTQAKLGFKVGLSAGYIGSVENGKKVLSLESLLMIAEALGVEPFELVPGQEEIKRKRAEIEGKVVERMKELSVSEAARPR